MQPLVDQSEAVVDNRFVKALPAASSELIKYVLVELDVPRVFHDSFQKEMRSLVEVMFDLKKWELVFAAYPITGEVNRFVHIWQIPNESSIIEVMREGALRSDVAAAQVGSALQQEFRDCYQRVQAMIQNTRHTLMTSLPYDPAHVGFQSQTIVIDADGELFLIDHDRLKGLEGRDISTDLETVRRAQSRVRTNKKVKEAGQHGELQHGLSADECQIVQSHLNHGSSVARIKVGNDDSLLFNLAALKSKSVYQSPAEVDNRPEKLKVNKPGTLDMRGALLIAAPWGSVYKLSEADLREIAVPIANSGSTKRAVQPLIDSKVPLAAIPEERDQTIGDGCACYVINLQSFCRSVG